MVSIFNRDQTAFELTDQSKACALPTVCSPKALSTLCNLCSIFLHLGAKFDADTLFFQFPHFLHKPQTQIEHTLVINKTLLNNHTNYSLNSEQQMTQQTPICLHLVLEVCAGSSTVILLSVQTLFHQHYKYRAAMIRHLQFLVQTATVGLEHRTRLQL